MLVRSATRLSIIAVLRSPCRILELVHIAEKWGVGGGESVGTLFYPINCTWCKHHNIIIFKMEERLVFL